MDINEFQHFARMFATASVSNPELFSSALVPILAEMKRAHVVSGFNEYLKRYCIRVDRRFADLAAMIGELITEEQIEQQL